MAKQKSPSPWCRGVEGQEHDVETWHPGNPPFCQPLRDFVRAGLEEERTAVLWATKSERELQRRVRHAEDRERRLAEDWECFHRQRCRRCRRNLPFNESAANCPVKQGLEPAEPPDPPQWMVARFHESRGT